MKHANGGEITRDEVLRYMAAALWFISAMDTDKSSEFEDALTAASYALSTALDKAFPGEVWTTLVPPEIKRNW